LVIDTYVELSPGAAMKLFTQAGVPLAFSIDFEAGGINQQVKRLMLGRGRELDAELAGTAAEGGVVRDRQIDLQQQEQGANQALSLPKREVVGFAQKQSAQDGSIAIELRAAGACGRQMIEPAIDG
jgi:hypothetical protein